MKNAVSRDMPNELGGGKIDPQLFRRLLQLYELVYQLQGQQQTPAQTRAIVQQQLQFIGLLGPLGQGVIGQSAPQDPQLTNLQNTSGTVTSIATGTGLTGGPIIASGTISLANTAVTPGTYTNTTLTVDQQGRITTASNGVGADTVYSALLTQSGAGDPVATVLQNTLTGTPIWTRASAGSYLATLVGAFPAATTGLLHGDGSGGTDATILQFNRSDDNTLALTTRDLDLSGPTCNFLDDLLVGTLVQILSY